MNAENEKKVVTESLEDVAMSVILNESPLDQRDIEGIKNAFKGIGAGFKSGLGDEIDNMLSAISSKRRKIQEMAAILKDYVSQIKDDGYWGQYKKETIAGLDKVLEGCEDIQSGHYHLLNATHAEMRANMAK